MNLPLAELRGDWYLRNLRSVKSLNIINNATTARISGTLGKTPDTIILNEQ
jgi:hypothetical protein